MARWVTTVVAVTAMTAAVLPIGAAWAASEKVQRNCRDDYLTYCASHPVGSTSGRRCMEANGRRLSNKCVNALVDAGEIPKRLRR